MAKPLDFLWLASSWLSLSKYSSFWCESSYCQTFLWQKDCWESWGRSWRTFQTYLAKCLISWSHSCSFSPYSWWDWKSSHSCLSCTESWYYCEAWSWRGWEAPAARKSGWASGLSSLAPHCSWKLDQIHHHSPCLSWRENIWWWSPIFSPVSCAGCKGLAKQMESRRCSLSVLLLLQMILLENCTMKISLLAIVYSAKSLSYFYFTQNLNDCLRSK